MGRSIATGLGASSHFTPSRLAVIPAGQAPRNPSGLPRPPPLPWTDPRQAQEDGHSHPRRRNGRGCACFLVPILCSLVPMLNGGRGRTVVARARLLSYQPREAVPICPGVIPVQRLQAPVKPLTLSELGIPRPPVFVALIGEMSATFGGQLFGRREISIDIHGLSFRLSALDGSRDGGHSVPCLISNEDFHSGSGI